MVKKLGVTELVRNALFGMDPKLPLSAEKKGNFFFQTAISRELRD